MSGTYWFKSKHDAEGTGKMLGLHGAFQIDTPEGTFWSPGKNQEELSQRVGHGISIPNPVNPPQAHVLTFREFCLRTT